MKRKILTTAHAGCMDTALDSLDSVNVALEWNSDVIELDIRFDSKGIPVLSHDKVLPEQEVALVVVEEVVRVAKEARNVRLNCDMKEIDKIEHLAALAKKYEMMERCFLTGIEPQNATKLVEMNHSFSYLINYPFREIDCSKEGLTQLAAQIRNLGGFGLNIHHPLVSKELVDFLHQQDLVVYAWTVDAKDEMNRMIQCGVDSITTNRLDLLKEVMGC